MSESSAHPLRRVEDQAQPDTEWLLDKVRLLTELLDVSRHLNSSLDLRTVLNHLIVVSAQILKAEAASIMLMDDKTGELIFKVASGEVGQFLEGFRLQPGEGIAGQAALSGNTQSIADVSENAHYSPRIDELSGFRTRNAIAVPLQYRGTVYGVLEILNLTGHLRKEDVERAETLASMAAQSVANARLVEELRRQQAELVQAGKLAAIGTIAAGVAHELNQPLTGIRAFTQMLLRNQERGTLTDAELRDKLMVIDRQVGRMTRIIGHLQTFARQSHLDCQVLDLNKVVTDSFMLLDELLHNGGVSVVKDLEADLPRILGDAVRLEEVILNLVLNARDATEGRPDARIIVRTWHDTMDATVKLSVADNGSGIDQGHLARIFDPFFTTKVAGKGTGLGLSITHGIIQEHRGTIKVSSEGAGGTTFTISLPQQQVEEA